MRRYILLYLLIGTILNATRVESQLGISIGVTATENSGGSKFKHPTLGVTYQDNSYVIMPRVDLEYVELQDYDASSLFKGSLNGVYEFKEQMNLVPYLLAGVGYENVQGSIKNEFESHPFVQGGMGANYTLKNDFKLNIESRMLQIIGGNKENNEIRVIVRKWVVI